MLPVIYRFTFSTPGEKALLYLVALALVTYAAWSGWRNATSLSAAGVVGEPTRQDRVNRAIIYGLVGTVLAVVGLYYALPEVPVLGRGKGEGVPVHTYGVLVGAGFITAVTVASWLAAREWPGELGLKRRDQLFDMGFYAFVGAMVGSRVLFMIVNYKDYAAQPSKIFDLGGGLVFQGGLIGASLTAYWFAKKNDIDFLRLADLCLPTVSLGQALGRLGCFSAGCCRGDIVGSAQKGGVHFPGLNATNLFGTLSSTPSLAYSEQIDDKRYVVEATGQVTHDAVAGSVQIAQWVAQHGHTLPVHPTQLYESFGQIILFSVMLLLRNYRRFHGQITGMWLMCSALLRTSVELFRGDVNRGTVHGLLEGLGLNSLASAVPLEAWYNMSTGQFISLCIFSLGAWLLISRSKALKLPELTVVPQPV